MSRKSRTIDASSPISHVRGTAAALPLLGLRAASAKLRIGDRHVKLTPNELRLVQLLRQSGGRPVSRASICSELWGRPGQSYYRRLEILVRRLRDKLGADHDLIQTVHGSGYRLRAPGLFNVPRVASNG